MSFLVSSWDMMWYRFLEHRQVLVKIDLNGLNSKAPMFRSYGDRKNLGEGSDTVKSQCNHRSCLTHFPCDGRSWDPGKSITDKLGKTYSYCEKSIHRTYPLPKPTLKIQSWVSNLSFGLQIFKCMHILVSWQVLCFHQHTSSIQQKNIRKHAYASSCMYQALVFGGGCTHTKSKYVLWICVRHVLILSG